MLIHAIPSGWNNMNKHLNDDFGSVFYGILKIGVLADSRKSIDSVFFNGLESFDIFVRLKNLNTSLGDPQQG